MPYLDYKRLEDIEQRVKPLRNTNKYPYFTGYRTSLKHFKPDVLDGEKVYRIFYSYTWGSEEIEKSEYKKLNFKEQDKWYYQNWNGLYAKYTKEESELGIVRPDNTFEFTASSLNQGDRNILSDLLGANVYSDVKRGGVVLYKGRYYDSNRVYIPLFKGQRLDINTLESVVDYEVHIPRVDRKKSNALTSQYKNQMILAEAMFKSMDTNNFVEQTKAAILSVEFDGNRAWLYSDFRNAIEKRIDEVINEDFVEASLLLIVFHRVGYIWSMTQGSIFRNEEGLPYKYYLSAKRQFTKKLKQTNDVFYDEVFKRNDAYPQTEWKTKLFFNGEEIKQYC